MQVVLLERVENLGQMGDVVKVRAGYARNYLLPRAKALRATKENLAYFETQKATLQAANDKRRKDAESKSKKVAGLTVPLIRAASEGGQLYGSVSARDIAAAVSAKSGVEVDRAQVTMDRNYKMLGLFPVKIVLHAEVPVEVTINIARSDEEAKIQEETGSALIVSDKREQTLEDEALARLEAEEAAAKAFGDDIAAEKEAETAEESEEKPARKKAAKAKKKDSDEE